MRAAIITIFGMVVVSTAGAGAVVNYSLDWFTIDSGGGTMSGSGFELSGTTGQSDATPASALTGGGYELTGGFWAVGLPPCASFATADFNHDCHVDASDLAFLKACRTGAGVPYNPASLPPGCAFTPNGQGHIPADLDSDGDVDQTDFAVFQRCISGPVQMTPVNCLP